MNVKLDKLDTLEICEAKTSKAEQAEYAARSEFRQSHDAVTAELHKLSEEEK